MSDFKSRTILKFFCIFTNDVLRDFNETLMFISKQRPYFQNAKKMLYNKSIKISLEKWSLDTLCKMSKSCNGKANSKWNKWKNSEISGIFFFFILNNIFRHFLYVKIGNYEKEFFKYYLKNPLNFLLALIY